MTELAVETVRPELDDAPFSRVCAVTEVEVSAEFARYRGVIDPVWTIGKKLHGGTMVASSAAAATTRLRTAHPDLAEMFPIAASTDFLGAPDPGEVEYEVESARRAARSAWSTPIWSRVVARWCIRRSPSATSTTRNRPIGARPWRICRRNRPPRPWATTRRILRWAGWSTSREAPRWRSIRPGRRSCPASGRAAAAPVDPSARRRRQRSGRRRVFRHDGGRYEPARADEHGPVRLGPDRAAHHLSAASARRAGCG